jgi:hypothetical protein
VNAEERAEWARIRDAEKAARLDRKARMAAALDPALVEGAERVYAALTDQCFWASIGFNGSRHIVTVRGVDANAKARVESVANKALKQSPRFPDVIAFASFIRIEVKFGRQQWEQDRITERGDGGTILVPDARGELVQIGTPHHSNPLANDSLDYSDPYAA